MAPEPDRIDTIIQGGEVVTHQSVARADLAIAGAKVVAFGDAALWPRPTVRRIDASGCYVLPGLIDPHVHLMGVFSIDDFRSGSVAAAFGGVTTIMDFAFQHCQFLNGRDGTIRDGLRDKQQLASGNSVVDYTWHCAITRENEETLDELAAIVDDERIPSFKFFMTYPFGVTHGIMYDAFARIAELGGTASVHAEDRELVLGNGDLTGYVASRYKRQGRSEPIWFARSRPHFAETIALSAALFLAEETGVQMYQVHQSAAGACELLRQAKARGLAVAAETCPHYLTLTERVYEEQGPLPIMCPPIRTSDDRSRLWRGIADGTIDTIGTDHA
ncbi:MAG TPA: amidohydrolase family protein, partial [Chloroflexota bacterium]